MNKLDIVNRLNELKECYGIEIHTKDRFIYISKPYDIIFLDTSIFLRLEKKYFSFDFITSIEPSALDRTFK